MTSLTDLPHNVLMDILARFPVKTLLAAKCVCKTFLDLVFPDPYFNALHSANASQILILQFQHQHRLSTRLYLLDPELDDATQNSCTPMIGNSNFQLPDCPPYGKKYSLMNSCNGLLLLAKWFWNNTAIRVHPLVCNPITNEYLVIGGEDEEHRLEKLVVSSWLGFSKSSNQYKILQVFWSRGDCDYRGEVLDVGSSLWRPIEGRAQWYSNFFQFYVSDAFLDGVIYWIDNKQTDSTVGFFDFEIEEFGVIEEPNLDQNQNITVSPSVGVLEDCLCVLYNYVEREELVMWVLEKSGYPYKWSKKFVVNTRGQKLCFIRPVQVLKNGEILLLDDAGDAVYYHPKNMSLRVVESGNEPSKGHLRTKDVNLTPSFASLKDTLKVNDKIIVNNRDDGDRLRLRNIKHVIRIFGREISIMC